jgi:sulfur-carrier protein adenylyltransferase/sulfurtransferase
MKLYQWKPQYIFVENPLVKNKVSLVGGGSSYDFTLSKPEIRDWFLKLKTGASFDELSTIMSAKDLEQLRTQLETKGLIRAAFANEFIGTPYEKHIPYFADWAEDPNKIQRELLNKTVMILGLGGVGAFVFQHLIALGITHFILVDFDKAQSSNLNRQLMLNSADIGRSKLEVLKEKALLIRADLQIQCLNTKIETAHEFLEQHPLLTEKNIDLIVAAADTPPLHIRIHSLQIAKKLNSPIIFAGVGFESGSFGPLLTEEEKINTYTQSLQTQLEALGSGEIGNVPMSIGYTNSLVSTLLVGDITSYFLKKPTHSLNQKMRIHFPTLSISPSEKL